MHSLSFEFQQWNFRRGFGKDESVVVADPLSLAMRITLGRRRAEKGIFYLMRNFHGNKDLTEIFSVKSIFFPSEGRIKVARSTPSIISAQFFFFFVNEIVTHHIQVQFR